MSDRRPNHSTMSNRPPPDDRPRNANLKGSHPPIHRPPRHQAATGAGYPRDQSDVDAPQRHPSRGGNRYPHRESWGPREAQPNNQPSSRKGHSAPTHAPVLAPSRYPGDHSSHGDHFSRAPKHSSASRPRSGSKSSSQLPPGHHPSQHTHRHSNQFYPHASSSPQPGPPPPPPPPPSSGQLLSQPPPHHPPLPLPPAQSPSQAQNGKLHYRAPTTTPPATPVTVTPQVVEHSEEVDDGLEEWDEEEDDSTKKTHIKPAAEQCGIVCAMLPPGENQNQTSSRIIPCELPSLRPKELTAVTSDGRRFQYMSTFRAAAWRAVEQKRPVQKGFPPPNWCQRFASADGISNLKSLRPTPADPRDPNRLTTLLTTRAVRRCNTWASDSNDPQDDERLLLISNLSDNAGESFLRDFLKDYGTVVKVEPIFYKGRYTAMTSVAFSRISEAEYAARLLKGKTVMGRELTARVDPMHRFAKAALQELVDKDLAELKIKEKKRLEEEEKRRKLEAEAAKRRKEEEEAEKVLREETKKRNAERERLEKLAQQRARERDVPVRTTPALRLAMLPARIGEVDLHTFFKAFGFRPSKIVAEGPFWLVFFRDKNTVPEAARRCGNERVMGFNFRLSRVDISEEQLRVLWDPVASADSRKEARRVPKDKEELIQWTIKALHQHYIEVARNTITEFELYSAARLLADQSYKSFLKTVNAERRAAKGRGLNAVQPIQFDWFAKADEEPGTAKLDKTGDGAKAQSRGQDGRRDKKRRLEKEDAGDGDGDADDDLDEMVDNVFKAKPKQQDEDFFVGFRERKARRKRHKAFVDSEASDEESEDDRTMDSRGPAVDAESEKPEHSVTVLPNSCARLMGLEDVKTRQKVGWQPPEFLDLVNSNAAPAAETARESRTESRKIRRGIENLDLEQNDLISFNALIARKKAVRFGKSRIHGYGLYAMQHIDPGEFVIEYVGEVVRGIVADLREKTYERQGMGDSYLFRLDLTDVVDATRKGAVARFINHSCEPSLTAKIIQVEGAPKIVFYTRRAIEVGSELTYDYKFNVEGDEEKIPCLCGAAQCKGTLN